jgi:hypothetical protein
LDARAPGPLLNLADCEERKGRVHSARTHFLEAADALSASDERRAFARSRADVLVARVPRVRLQLPSACREAPCAVLCDGRELKTATLGAEMPLDPGAHRFVLRAAGHEAREASVVLAESETRALPLDPGPPLGSGVADEPVGGRRTAAYAVGALGLAALATGAVTGALAFDRGAVVRSHCDAAGCDAEGLAAGSAGGTFATASTVLVISGAAITAVAIFLFASSPKAKPASAAAALLSGTF